VLTLQQQRTRDLLRAAYRDFGNGKLDAPFLNDADRAFLVEELGWFGRLALHPKPNHGAADEGRTEAIRPAEVTAIAAFSMIFLGGLFICIGFAGIILFAVLAWNGSLTWRFQVRGSDGGVYAETFAIWLVGYFGATVANSVLSLEIPYLTRGIIVMLVSLLVLIWPIARGIPWRQVRQDIGWVCPGNPLTEIAAGVCCYIINLPLVALGFIITVSMLLFHAKLQTPTGGDAESFSNESVPTHPILQFLSEGDWATLAQVFLLACVVAPLVEETMFRGVLHRHCRELTGRWRPLAGALFSTVVVSFVFAVVHPQGLMVVPVLMALAFGFSLAREWRVSLLPSMFAHGMSNGIVLTMATIALSK
jgi:membrane protease YdiL (CAAX protease family)